MAQAVYNPRNEPQRTSIQISIDDNGLLQLLAGERNANLKIIERQLDVQVHLRGNQLTVSGIEPMRKLPNAFSMNWPT